MADRIVEATVIDGPPALVWSLVIEARHFRRWYAFGGAEIDLRAGGAITLRWNEHGAFHAVVESVIPGELFSFRWQPEPGSLVEIALRPEGNRTTRVQIVESGALEDAAQRGLAWRNGLKLLGELAKAQGDGDVPGPRDAGT